MRLAGRCFCKEIVVLHLSLIQPRFTRAGAFLFHSIIYVNIVNGITCRIASLLCYACNPA